MSASYPDTVTVAEYLFERLRQLGVDHILGVPGDFNLALLDALAEHDAPAWVGTANELGAAYAADGYARERGFGALITTYGVGELSALNGIAGSCAEQVPVLHIVGTPRTAAVQSRAPLHHTLLDGDFDHFVRAAAEVTCAQAVLAADEDPGAQIDVVLRSMLDASLPGYLAIPDDLVSLPVQAAPLAVALTPTPSPANAAGAFRAAAATLLADARDVVVLAGAGVARADAAAALRELAEAAQLPVATLIDAKGILSEDHPLSLGVYQGAITAPQTREIVERAEVLIRVGVRLSDLNSGGFTAELDGPATIELALGDAAVDGTTIPGLRLRDALGALRVVLGERTPRTPGGVPVLERDHARAAAVADDEPLTQAALWPAVAGALGDGDIVVADVGTSLTGIGAETLPRDARLIAQPVWSSIGYALPATLGVGLAAPDRRAVLLTGDGAAQMTIQELGTIARAHLHPLIVLVDNAGYTIEREIRGRHAAYNDVAPWDWGLLTHALTDASQAPLVLHARTEAELHAALATARRRPDRLVLVHAQLDPHDVPQALSAMVGALAARR